MLFILRHPTWAAESIKIGFPPYESLESSNKLLNKIWSPMEIAQLDRGLFTADQESPESVKNSVHFAKRPFAKKLLGF